MSLTAWLVIGVVAAFIANGLERKRGLGLGYDILLGMAGSVIAGFAVDWLAGSGRTGLNPWSITASGFGAGLVLAFSASLRQRSDRSGRALRPGHHRRPIRR